MFPPSCAPWVSAGAAARPAGHGASRAGGRRPNRRSATAAASVHAGAELQQAEEFLAKTTPRRQLGQLQAVPAPAARPLLLAAPAPPAATAAELSTTAAGQVQAWTAQSSTLDSQASGERAATEATAEVDGLLGLLLPQRAVQSPEGQQAPGAAAAPLPPAQAAPQPAQQLNKLAAQPAGGAPAERSSSRAKVLRWLSASNSAAASEDSPADAIPAVHAASAAPLPSAHLPAGPVPSAACWRTPPKPAPALWQAPTAPRYSTQPQLASPRRLALARPACRTCGQLEASCLCAPAAAAPLRLLRPRQPIHCSPHLDASRHPAAGCGMPADAPQSCVPAPAGQAGVSIGSIQNAYFGGGSGNQCAAAVGWQPAAAPMLPPPNSADPAPVEPGLDIWRAYLASRAAPAAAVASAAASSAGGPLAQLQAIGSRIRGMQHHISTFLTQQQTGPWGPAPAELAPAPAGSRVAAQPAVAAPGPPAAGSTAPPCPAAAQPARPGGQPQELFTDDFVLSMQLGTDVRRLEQAALAGAGAAGGGGGALQRLKEAQRVVKAVRVGRQGRGA